MPHIQKELLCSFIYVFSGDIFHLNIDFVIVAQATMFNYYYYFVLRSHQEFQLLLIIIRWAQRNIRLLMKFSVHKWHCTFLTESVTKTKIQFLHLIYYSINPWLLEMN